MVNVQRAKQRVFLELQKFVEQLRLRFFNKEHFDVSLQTERPAVAAAFNSQKKGTMDTCPNKTITSPGIKGTESKAQA